MVKVLVSMPKEFLDLIDDFANNEQRTRSELVREALRGYIRRKNLTTNLDKNAKTTEKIEELLK